MDEQLIQLGRRAMNAGGWKQPDTGFACILVAEGMEPHKISFHFPKQGERVEAIPDFSHWSARGFLLALVREAHSDPGLCIERECTEDGVEEWEIVGWSSRHNYRRHHPTEAEALVAALEAALNDDGEE